MIKNPPFMTEEKQHSDLVQGNAVFRNKDYANAIRHYLRALKENGPLLFNRISANLQLARSRHCQQRSAGSKPSVAVCGCGLAHSKAGRVYRLAQIYQTVADVEIIGGMCIERELEISQLSHDTEVHKHIFTVEKEYLFVNKVVEFVAAHPYDIIHLANPCMPNTLFGLLYKLVWGAKVLVDIGEEGLALVDAHKPFDMAVYLEKHQSLPECKDLNGEEWTRIAARLVMGFDGVTVATPELQQRYGDKITCHASEGMFFLSPAGKTGGSDVDRLRSVIAGEIANLPTALSIFKDELPWLLAIFELARDNKAGNLLQEGIPGPGQSSIASLADETQSQYEGKIEEVDKLHLKGWVLARNDPSSVFSVTLLVDGLPYSELTNNVLRGDLKHAGKSTGRGGVREVFPNKLFNKESHELTIRLPDGSLLPSVKLPGVDGINRSKDRIPQVPLIPSITIIVPIFNALEDLIVCIDRLLRHTPPAARIFLINDASTDSRVAEILEEADREGGVTVLTNPHNLGFTRTVNRGIREAGQDDVVLLNSDARVTPRWLEGLRRAAGSDARIGTVTPMSDRAGAFSAPLMGNENTLPNHVNEIDYAMAFRRRSQGLYPVVPTGNGFCMYIRRSCIDEVGMFDESAFPRGYGEENDFCMRARQAAWINIVDDRTYVFHDRGKSFKDEKSELLQAGRKVLDARYPDYQAAIKVFSEGAPLKLARFRARQALEDCKLKPLVPRRVLFVISMKTGGTPQTNLDLMGALGKSWEPWLLYCDSQTLTLARIVESVEELRQSHVLTEVVEPLTHRSREYDRVLANWLSEYDFEVVHIRHLAFHSLSLPRLAREAGAAVVFSFHDYYTICPTVKLLNGENIYCGGICTAGSGNCVPDLWKGHHFPEIKNGWVNFWRANFASALQLSDCFVTTSVSAKTTLVGAMPFLEDEKFHVIPHGRDFGKFHDLAAPVERDESLRILVPGNISDAKGMEVIKTLLEKDVDNRLAFHILGKCSSSWTHPRLFQHGAYERDNFPECVKNIRPHIGAVLSIWNETWCHTLTELWAVGLPVTVFNYGTISQRMDQCGGGWVFDKEDVGALYEHLAKCSLELNLVEEKRHKVLAWQKGEGKINNVRRMAAQYEAVYQDARRARTIHSIKILPEYTVHQFG